MVIILSPAASAEFTNWSSFLLIVEDCCVVRSFRQHEGALAHFLWPDVSFWHCLMKLQNSEEWGIVSSLTGCPCCWLPTQKLRYSELAFSFKHSWIPEMYWLLILPCGQNKIISTIFGQSRHSITLAILNPAQYQTHRKFVFVLFVWLVLSCNETKTHTSAA